MGYYEYKYTVPHAALPYVRSVLDALFGGTDPFPSGDVDSLYYDTVDGQCLRQCVGGDVIKHKFRIRGYGDGTYSQVHLKEKNLSQVSKTKGRIAPLTLLRGNAPEWLALEAAAGDAQGFAAIMAAAQRYGVLVPALRVQYHRIRYRQFDLRLTLDTNIKVETFGNGRHYTRTHLVLPNHVLEIKTADPRPHLPLLGLIKLPPASFSKYKLGSQLLDSATLETID